jgi:hypothetical protein
MKPKHHSESLPSSADEPVPNGLAAVGTKSNMLWEVCTRGYRETGNVLGVGV